MSQPRQLTLLCFANTASSDILENNAPYLVFRISYLVMHPACSVAVVVMHKEGQEIEIASSSQYIGTPRNDKDDYIFLTAMV